MELGHSGSSGAGPIEPEPADPALSGATAPEAPVAPPPRAPRRTRVSSTWVGIALAAILLILLIIFIAENSQQVKVSFLGATGHFPLAIGLLIAAVAGIVLTLLVGSLRILQLRRDLRRQRRHIRRQQG